jgi:N-acetylmuramoyl-L-alanine amidase
LRDIKNIVIHCTATPLSTTVESIKRYWREHLGWKNPGYHFLIEKNGNVQYLHDIEKVANGVRGHNQNSIHIAYIGGVDKNQRAIDNRTRQQCISMLLLVNEFHEMFPEADIKGHRDFSGVAKDCPSFDVKKWISANGFKI